MLRSRETHIGLHLKWGVAVSNDFPFGFPNRNIPLGLFPAPAPFTAGSKFKDVTDPPEALFTIARVAYSDFGDVWVFDLNGEPHDGFNCQVVEYLPPEVLEQRKQDATLGRLMDAYGL